jgi:hypothetical protein
VFQSSIDADCLGNRRLWRLPLGSERWSTAACETFERRTRRDCDAGSPAAQRPNAQVLSNALFTHRTFRSGARSVARRPLDGVGRQLAPGPCARAGPSRESPRNDLADGFLASTGVSSLRVLTRCAGPSVNRRGMTSQTGFSPAQAAPRGQGSHDGGRLPPRRGLRRRQHVPGARSPPFRVGSTDVNAPDA